MLIRHASKSDLDAILSIVDENKTGDHPAFGFVRTDTLVRGIEKGELFVAKVDGHVAGFVNWHARGNGWSTIYEIAVNRQQQGQGIGRALLYSVPCPIQLKCTADNDVANAFYRGAGMFMKEKVPGRKRILNSWELRVLSIIVRGNSKDAPEIARKSGNAYGIHHHDKAYAWPYMVDSDPVKCDWPAMMEVVNAWHPVQALTMDYYEGQRETMLSQVNDLREAGVFRVAVCPKFHGAIADIPADCIVAVSLRTNGKLAKGKKTAYAGFMPDFMELTGRKVHLLGGSPSLQRDTLLQLQGIGVKVLSIDGSAHFGAASKGSHYEGGKWRRKNGEKVDAYASQLKSSININRELNAAAGFKQLSLWSENAETD